MNNKVRKVFEGKLNATGLRFGIVCARFNEFFVSKLLDGALDTLIRHSADSKNIDVAWVPGSFEIPMIANKLAVSGNYDAILALGVVIQGATPHASYINAEVSKSLAQISLKTDIPVAYGMITADNIEQAIERSGTKAGNKGGDAAMCAIEMANLMKNIK